MKRFFKNLIKISAVLTSLVILLSAYIAPASAASGILVHGKLNFDYANEMFGYINDYRVKNGLSKLKSDFDLVESAMIRAAECSVNCSHVRPNGKMWNTVVKWEESVAENFAMGFSNPREATDAYYNSEGHKANMLGDFTRVGVGVFTTDAGANYWIHIFTCGEVKETYVEKGVREVAVNVADDPDEATTFNFSDGEETPFEKAADYEKAAAPEIGSVSLSKTVFEYNGRTQTPAVTVKDENGNKLMKKYYSVKKPEKSVTYGEYSIKVVSKHSGKTLEAEYKIIPKATSITSVSKMKTYILVRWNRVSTTTSGVKLSYGKNKSFKGAKTITLPNSKTSKMIKGLKKGRYYFRIRAYKKLDAETYYSSWSKSKSVKTKTKTGF